MKDTDYPGLGRGGLRYTLGGRPLPRSDTPAPSSVSRWRLVRSRCCFPSDPNYARWGGRGIDLAEEYRYWPAGFLRWCDELGCDPFGNIPDGLQVDRIDNSRGYEPGNIRLVSPKVNSNNRATSVRLTTGETLAEFASARGLNYYTVWSRWSAGERDFVALAEPPKRHRAPRDSVFPVDSCPPRPLRVYNVLPPNGDEDPGYISLPINLAGCHIACPFCFNRELWDTKSAQYGWSEVKYQVDRNAAILDSVTWTGGDPLAQDLGAFLRLVHEAGLRNNLFATPTHPARLRNFLAAGLLDRVHLSLKGSDVPAATEKFQRKTLRVLADHSGAVDLSFEFVYTRHTKPEAQGLEALLHEYFPDEELVLTRALNPDYLKGDIA